MDSNQKKFGSYVFLSTFARNLIEVFIPIILYKFGFPLKEVILYYLIVNVFTALLTYPCIYISNKFGSKTLAIIGIISFAILQILLNFINYSIWFLISLAFIYALYSRGYWVSRRFYNLRVIRKENVSYTYSLISIINHIGLIFSTYIGSVLLDFMHINVLTIISIILFLIGTIPLYLLNFEHKEAEVKIEPLKTIKAIPKTNIFLFGSYELINVVKFLFTLYLFLYIKDNYQTVGILNLVANLSTILFAYFYGKKINRGGNFLHISIFLVTLTYFLKLNVTSYALLLISFLEGIFLKMYEISIQKEFYVLSKKFEYNNYNFIYELTENVFRTIMVAILYFFIEDLKTMIIVVLLVIVCGIFCRFKISPLNDFNK